MAEENKNKDDSIDALREVMIAERDSLKYDAPDSELANNIDKLISESSKLKKEMDEIGDSNVKYWKGEQLDLSKIKPQRSKVIDNRIFISCETIIPILTTNIPEPQIEGNIDNEVQEKLLKILRNAYEVKQEMPKKLRKFVRHWMTRRVGVLKYRWDEGFITEVVNPKKIGFDPKASCLEEAEFIYEYLEDTIENLMDKFPRAKKKLINEYGEERIKSKVRYVEFWGDNGKWVCWKLGNVILDKSKNPNFDYTGIEEPVIDEFGQELKETRNYNIFKKPKFPYLIGNFFQLGDTIYDNTTLVEQSKPLQDSINKRKNQISDLTDLNKRVWVASSLSINKEDFQLFLDKTGENGIYLSQGDISQIQAISGGVDANAFSDLAHSTGEVDNISGTHSTIRGEKNSQQETLGGRQLLMNADYSRLGVIMEDLIEQVCEDWYNAYLHMMLLYSQEDFEFAQGDKTVVLNKEEIPEGINIIVQKGATLLVDKETRVDMAKALIESDYIDPETLFEEWGYSNPTERANKLFDWWRLQGKIPEQKQIMPPSGHPLPSDAAIMQAQQMQQAPPPQEVPQEQGGEELAKQQEYLARLNQIISSPEFEQMSDEDKQQIIAQAKQLVEIIKGSS